MHFACTNNSNHVKLVGRFQVNTRSCFRNHVGSSLHTLKTHTIGVKEISELLYIYMAATRMPDMIEMYPHGSICGCRADYTGAS